MRAPRSRVLRRGNDGYTWGAQKLKQCIAASAISALILITSDVTLDAKISRTSK